MPYTPTVWVDRQTKLGPTNLNKLEQGLSTAAATADAAQTAAAAAQASGIPLTQKAAANGVATLDAASKLVVAQLPLIPVAQLPVGVANGVASLDSGVKVPVAQIPTLSLPGAELAAGQITANVSITATAEASAQVVITAPAVTVDGSTQILIVFSSQSLITSGGAAILWLFEDGVSLGRVSYISTGSAPISVLQRRTPAAGSRTYSIRGTVSAGTGTLAAGLGGPGNDAPAFIRITRA